MTSSELSDDEYHYLNYVIELFPGDNRPPLIKKESRLLYAAVNNDVQTLRTLLDSPKWYKVRDKAGYNLLHIAIMTANKEAFDFLLSLDDFPLEEANNAGNTAAMLTLMSVFEESFKDEYYALELVKRGVDANSKLYRGNSLLHGAVECNFVRVMRLLIDRGADLDARNDDGRTPLHICVKSRSKNRDEMIAMLLCSGADPSVPDYDGYTPLEVFFQHYYHFHEKDLTVHGNLLYFSIDQWSKFEFPCLFLFQIAYMKSTPLESLISLITDLKCGDKYDNWFCVVYLFIMDADNLNLLLGKFSSVIKQLLQNYVWVRRPSSYYDKLYKGLNVKNIDIIHQTFPSEVSEFVSNINSIEFLHRLLNYSTKSYSEKIQLVFCLLSHGMTLCMINLGPIFQLTGYNKDFRSIIHMDLCKCLPPWQNEYLFSNILCPLHVDTDEIIYHTNVEVMTHLICDATLNVDSIFEYYKINLLKVKTLFEYFAHPKLVQGYRKHAMRGDFVEGDLPPVRVPLLQELARDGFRQHFVKVFQIKNARQFFILLDLLPISSVFKKIITFDTKLYR